MSIHSQVLSAITFVYLSFIFKASSLEPTPGEYAALAIESDSVVVNAASILFSKSIDLSGPMQAYQALECSLEHFETFCNKFPNPDSLFFVPPMNSTRMYNFIGKHAEMREVCSAHEGTPVRLTDFTSATQLKSIMKDHGFRSTWLDLEPKSHWSFGPATHYYTTNEPLPSYLIEHADHSVRNTDILVFVRDDKHLEITYGQKPARTDPSGLVCMHVRSAEDRKRERENCFARLASLRHQTDNERDDFITLMQSLPSPPPLKVVHHKLNTRRTRASVINETNAYDDWLNSFRCIRPTLSVSVHGRSSSITGSVRNKRFAPLLAVPVLVNTALSTAALTLANSNANKISSLGKQISDGYLRINNNTARLDRLEIDTSEMKLALYNINRGIMRTTSAFTGAINLIQRNVHIINLHSYANSLIFELREWKSRVKSISLSVIHDVLPPGILTETDITRMIQHSVQHTGHPIFSERRDMRFSLVRIGVDIQLLVQSTVNDDNEFRMHEIVPLPMIIDNKSMIVQIPLNFVGINVVKQRYIVLSSPPSCLPHLRCRVASIEYEFDKATSCGLDVLVHTIDPICEYAPARETDVFVRLHTGFVYATNATTVKALCPDEITHTAHHISGTGFYKTDPLCEYSIATSTNVLHVPPTSSNAPNAALNPDKVRFSVRPGTDEDYEPRAFVAPESPLYGLPVEPRKLRELISHQQQISTFLIPLVAIVGGLTLGICLWVGRVAFFRFRRVFDLQRRARASSAVAEPVVESQVEQQQQQQPQRDDVGLNVD